ncbi:secretion protein HlyD [Jiangella mangrovi]|uniref:Multidrug efflux pump subunit AcrA (Membrane-fusion protein) n=1 Tax=Jiangella mangrovi TaxID=1524084 RepID=A0A7W9GTD4_9ACTN|nr:secretion protein HlyD [Jiangella mangrovi]MBB5789443.1 multidrug efflux pump subunit AcrA (membrane-fusion protein) [Jiangella mangrovi]
MGVTRRIVLPTIKILLLAAIAALLAYIAFRDTGETAAADDPAVPSVEIVQPEVPVALGTVVNTVEVEATITADAPTPVRATDGGEVTVLHADPGEVVEEGDPLVEVVFEEEGEPTTETDDEGNEVEVPGEPVRRFRTIEAATAGTVGEFDVLVGQTVAVGDTVGSISTGGFTVSGSLTAEQQYRLVSGPTAAEVQARGGPAPFACADLRTGRSATGGDGGDEGGAAPPPDPMLPPDQSGGGSSTAISCTVPPDVTVFDGLGATMVIKAGRAENVLVVPVTAVEGSFESGNVWVVGADGGEPVETPVTLGLTDGELIEVREGLAEGDLVLEFVPGAPDEDAMDPGMMGQAG